MVLRGIHCGRWSYYCVECLHFIFIIVVWGIFVTTIYPGTVVECDHSSILRLCTIMYNIPTFASKVGYSIHHCTTHGGNTPLHLACQQNHRNTVELLLAHPDINPDMVNTQGDTPRMVAERMGNLGPLFDAVMPRGVRSHKE